MKKVLILVMVMMVMMNFTTLAGTKTKAEKLIEVLEKEEKENNYKAFNYTVKYDKNDCILIRGDRGEDYTNLYFFNNELSIYTHEYIGYGVYETIRLRYNFTDEIYESIINGEVSLYKFLQDESNLKRVNPLFFFRRKIVFLNRKISILNRYEIYAEDIRDREPSLGVDMNKIKRNKVYECIRIRYVRLLSQ